MALHEQAVGKTDEWYTPPEVFEALGCFFDLDVAAPADRVLPWVPAKHRITSDSLNKQWSGFVWMNPPFGGRNGISPWLSKFTAHANGVALTPDRTSAPWWQEWVPKAECVLFVQKKIKFIGADGLRGTSPAQGTCLLSFGVSGSTALRRAQQSGFGALMQHIE
jgi:hypothetical protein